MLLDKYDGITGDELPRKTLTTKKIHKVESSKHQRKIMKICKQNGYGWGSAVNKSCEKLLLPNGNEVEAYFSPWGGNLISLFILY